MAEVIVRPRVFLDVSQNTEPLGRLVIELFGDKAPKTCENFRSLCTASFTPQDEPKPLTYKLSPFHRVIDEFMIQGGDITAGNGTGGKSVYGGEFQDENIGWREIDAPGLVCMANRGKGTNTSQFFITLAPCPHLNAKHTLFGHLVSGTDVLTRIAAVKVDKIDRPLDEILISHCGELERHKKASQPARKPSNPFAQATKRDPSNHFGNSTNHNACQDAIDRGRKRAASSSSSPSQSSFPRHDRHQQPKHSSALRSPQSPHSPLPSQVPSRRDRRRSDVAVDETRRGRTLTRSPSPSSSRPLRYRSPEPTRTKRRRRSESQSRGNEVRSSRRRLRRSRERRERRENDKRNEHSRSRDEYGDDERRREEERRRWEGGTEGDYRGRNGDESLNGDGDAGNEVKFKGRGSMKFRERRW